MIDFTKNKSLGTILFYILWPLVWFYAPLRVRVRVILKVKNEVLLVKNWFGPNVWQLPGGGMKMGESSIDTARREMKEELGLTEQEHQLSLVSESVYIVKQRGLLLRYQYAVITMNKKPELNLSNEITEFVWEPVEKVSLPNAVESLL
jgi:8-oxo-dGTP pyrophosphatase MutT (NUDIX family)